MTKEPISITYKKQLDEWLQTTGGCYFQPIIQDAQEKVITVKLKDVQSKGVSSTLTAAVGKTKIGKNFCLTRVVISGGSVMFIINHNPI